jgi:hypothetical protein
VAALLPALSDTQQTTWEEGSPFAYMINEKRPGPSTPLEKSGTPDSFQTADFFASELTTPGLSLEADLRDVLTRRPCEVFAPEDGIVE